MAMLNSQRDYLKKRIVIRGKISRPLPEPLPMITPKSWLKIPGVTVQENPIMWDMQLDEIMSKAYSRLHVHYPDLQILWVS